MFVNIYKKNYDTNNFAVIVLFIGCSKGNDTYCCCAIFAILYYFFQ